VPQRRGPYPCPRDRELERQVWDALEPLASCAEQRGDVEVRVEIANAQTSWHVTRGDLERTAVGRCAGAGLQAVRTALRPTRMIVSFRMELR
jgi:hypothetical protein